MTIRLVLADDHPIVLDGLVRLFQGEVDFEVVARASNCNETLQAVRRLLPDVLVLDMRMPEKDGLAVLREMVETGIQTRVVILTALHTYDLIEAIRLGAKGVVLKETATQVLVRCVREVHAGRTWLERSVAAQTVEGLLRRDQATRAIAEALTPREMEVARYVAEGLHSKAVARKLAITEGTTKLYLHNVYRKLGLDGRVALARYMQSHGLA